MCHAPKQLCVTPPASHLLWNSHCIFFRIFFFFSVSISLLVATAPNRETIATDGDIHWQRHRSGCLAWSCSFVSLIVFGQRIRNGNERHTHTHTDTRKKNVIAFTNKFKKQKQNTKLRKKLETIAHCCCCCCLRIGKSVQKTFEETLELCVVQCVSRSPSSAAKQTNYARTEAHSHINCYMLSMISEFRKHPKCNTHTHTLRGSTHTHTHTAHTDRTFSMRCSRYSRTGETKSTRSTRHQQLN